jgi:hypothetical protein
MPLAAQAQLALTGASPAPHAPAAAATPSLGLTFSQAPTAASLANVRVLGNLSKGRRTVGSATVAGTSATVPLAGGSFLPGEQVQVTVPASVKTGAGTAATPYVYRYTAAAAAAPASFQNHYDLTVSTGPKEVLTGDLNEDGVPDLVVRETYGFRVLTGQGNGGFTSTSSLGMLTGLVKQLLADVNGDGHLDLLLLGSGTVAMYPGTGTGSFGSFYDVIVPGTVQDMTVGDMNGDGLLDVVCSTTNAIFVLPGLSNGQFGTVVSTATALTYTSLETGDVNNDGRLDVVAHYAPSVPGVGTPTLDVLLGNANGTLNAAFVRSTTLAMSKLRLTDLNGDGLLDLVGLGAVLNSNYLYTYSLHARLGAGDGTFGTPAYYPPPRVSPFNGNVFTDVQVADVNGDGRPDVLMSGYYNSTTPAASVGMYLNLGNGVLASRAALYTSGQLTSGSLAVADFNSDGQLDIAMGSTATATARTADKVTVYLNSPALAPAITTLTPASGQPGSTVTITGSNFQNLTSVLFTSFNGTTVAASFTLSADGTTITATVPATAQTGPVTVTVPGGQSATTAGVFTVVPLPFALSSRTPTGAAATGTALLPTLKLTFTQVPTVASLAGIRAYGLTTGTRRVAGPATVAGFEATVPLTGGDFRPGELVQVVVPTSVTSVSGSTLSAPATFNLQTAAGSSSGKFANKVDYTTGAAPMAHTLADVTGDGQLDLVTVNKTAGTVSVLAGVGDGTFGAKTDYPVFDLPQYIVAAELNNDGRADLLITYNSNSLNASSISVLLSQASGGFTHAHYLAGFGGGFPGVGDLNGDGYPDIAATSYSYNYVRVLRNNGAGAFTDQGTYSTAGLPVAAQIADMTGDGLADIITVNDYGGDISLLVAQAAGGYTTRAPVALGAYEPRGMVVGDVNRDGYPDLAIASYGNSLMAGSVKVILSSPGGFSSTYTSYSASATGVTSVALSDVNGDNYPDLVYTTVGLTATPKQLVSVRLNSGTGTFGSAIDYATTGRPTSVYLADLNNNGRLDLTTSTAAGNVASVMLDVLTPAGLTFTPSSGPPGTAVTVSGNNLFSASSVAFVGGSVTAGYTVNAAGTQISNVVVPAAAQTGPLTVTNPAGSLTSAASFTVTAAPYNECASAVELTAAATCTPVAGSVGAATQSLPPSACGGSTSTTAQDVWYSFVANGLTPTVQLSSAFDGVLEVFNGSCGSLTPRSCVNNAGAGDTETMTLTGLTAGTRYYLRVYRYTTATSTAPADASFSICLTVPAPVITSFTPAVGSAGTTTVTVFGLNLSGVTAVAVNGVAATNVVVNATGSSLTFTIPAGASTGRITVTGPGGTATSATNLVVAAPLLAVTQAGTAYPNNGTTAYAFGSTTLPATSAVVSFTLTNAGQLPLAISSIATTGEFILSGTVPTTVAANGGTATVGVQFAPTVAGTRTGTLVITSAAGTYTVRLSGTGVAPVPVVTSISPTTAVPGTTVTVTGSGFFNVTSVTGGNGNYQPAISGFTVSADGTTITFVVPANLLAGVIKVRTQGGTGSSSTPLCVLYTPRAAGVSGCAGSSIHLTALDAPLGATYQWYAQATGGTALSTASFGDFHTPALAATTTYYVALNTGGGCEGARLPVVATVLPTPTVSVSTNTGSFDANGTLTVCAGSSVILTASGASSYQWNNGPASASVLIPAGGFYTVAGYNSNGCSSYVTVYVLVVAQPTAAPTAISAGRCGTGPVTLVASGAASGSTYAWYSSASASTPVATTTTGSYTTPSLSATTTYYVAIRNTGSCESSRTSVTATVNSVTTPTIAASGPTSICPGGSVTLTASGGSSYRWSNGATTASITVGAAGSYSVAATNATGCSATSAAVVVSTSATPATPSIAQATQLGGAVLLTSSAASGNQWYLNGVLISGATGATYLAAQASQSGSYTVVVTSAGGCASGASAPSIVSVVLAATLSAQAAAVQVFPNPAHGAFTVELPGQASATPTLLLNALGQVVWQGTLAPGTTRTIVPVAGLASGLYVLRLRLGSADVVQRLTVE